MIVQSIFSMTDIFPLFSIEKQVLAMKTAFSKYWLWVINEPFDPIYLCVFSDLHEKLVWYFRAHGGIEIICIIKFN